MGSAVGELSGANRRAARSAGNAAMLQQAEAKKFMQHQAGLSADVKKAADDPRALLAQEEALSAQSRQLGRQEELINAINPALKEAAVQALGLLKGEKSAALGPLEQQRNRQRQSLLNTLREQLGPGAETSSAGQRALQNFDQETSMLMGNAQQTSLGQLLGLSANVRPDMGAEIGNYLNVSNAGLNRALTASSARSNFMSQAFGNTIQTAGASEVGNQVRAQQMQRLGGEAFGAGAMALTAGMMTPGGGGFWNNIGNAFGMGAASKAGEKVAEE